MLVVLYCPLRVQMICRRDIMSATKQEVHNISQGRDERRALATYTKNC